jgi:hypothetical protein
MTAGISQTKCATLGSNLALNQPNKNAGINLNARIWEKGNSNLPEEVGRSKSGNISPRFRPTGRGLQNRTML